MEPGVFAGPVPGAVLEPGVFVGAVPGAEPQPEVLTGPLPSREPETASRSRPAPGREHPQSPSWERPDDPGHTHDPNEVTVQLDGTGRQLDDWLVPQDTDAPGAGEGSDGPVFVDESGRRSRRFRRLGILVGIACAVYAVVIVATLLSGNSNAPWLPVPGQQDDQPAGKVDTSPLPAEPVKPSSGPGSGSPGVGATASDGTTPSPGASPTPGASGSAAAPGSSTDPKPSASATKKPNPGSTGTTKAPDPSTGPSAPVVQPPTPTLTDSAPTTAAPSGSPAGDGGGSGNVAGGPVEQSPIAQSPPTTEPGAPSSSYPGTTL